MPKRLPPIHIGKMHFDHWDVDGRDRVANCNAGMGVCAWIDQQYVALAARLLNSVDDPTLAVRLKRLNLHFEFASQLLELLVDISQAGSAVNLGLSFAKQIKVRSMNDQHRYRATPAALRSLITHLRSFSPRHHPRTTFH